MTVVGWGYASDPFFAWFGRNGYSFRPAAVVAQERGPAIKVAGPFSCCYRTDGSLNGPNTARYGERALPALLNRLQLVLVVVVALCVVPLIIASRAPCLDAPEEAVAFAVGARREIQCPRHATASAIAEGQRPKAMDDNWVSIFVPKKSLKTALAIEGHDRAASEVSDQQLIGVCAKEFG